MKAIGSLPATSAASPGLAEGGERPAVERFVSWRQRLLADYDENHDDLAGDQTSRLSAYLRFGCVSPLEVAIGAAGPAAGAARRSPASSPGGTSSIR